MKNTTQQPLKWKWTGPIDNWEIQLRLNGLISVLSWGCSGNKRTNERMIKYKKDIQKDQISMRFLTTLMVVVM